jgi:hypothetical protein
MKKIRSFFTVALVACVPLICTAQAYQVEEMLNVYQQKVEPHLRALTEREFGGAGTTDLEKAAFHSRVEMLKSKTRLINKDVKEQLEKLKDQKIEKAFVQRIIDAGYRQHYTGLPRQFFDECHRDS